MKKIYSLIVLSSGLLVSSTALAQPTLTAANATTNIGESMTYYVADSFASDMAAVTGASVTWDYSQLTGYGTTADNDIVDATTTANASDYPASSVADIMQGNLSLYRNNHTDSVVSQGYLFTEATLGTVLVQLTDHMTLIEYPFTFGTSFTDNLAGTADAFAQTLPLTGTVTVEGDGWGTLMLGPSTFTNVLRVKVSEASVADAGILGMVPVDRVQYMYYDPTTSNFPLFIHTSLSAQGNSQVAVYSSVMLTCCTDVPDSEPLSQMTLYPNPADEMTSVSFSMGSAGVVDVEVINSLGQKIIKDQRNLGTGNQRIEISTVDFKPGIYFVKLTSGGQEVTRKLMVR